MKTAKELEQELYGMDGRGYPAYKGIKGGYSFSGFNLVIQRVQADPFASPSKLYAVVERKVSGIPDLLLDSRGKRRAVADFLIRTFEKNIDRFYKGVKGSGKSGDLRIDHCGQEILERTAVVITEETLEVRFEVGLPAAGRRILGKAAREILIEALPQIIRESLYYKHLPQEKLKEQVDLVEDQEYIRRELEKMKLVAFVANGSMLPRESGVSDKVMREGVPFKSPESLEVEFTPPHRGVVKGMGIKEGITLVVGGGYHGKSTLLNALELGVYDHIAGDGREYVITCSSGVKVRSEDGRSVTGVDIRPFINHLPNGKNTQAFSTENASGSTSQATNVMEALEVGATLLLIDEDTSATNFMIRDGRMQLLVAKEKEPITPFIDKVKCLYQEKGVSTILIIGGSGDYFDVANTVIMMDSYLPKDVTSEAKAISEKMKSDRQEESSTFGSIQERRIKKQSFHISGERFKIKIKGKEKLIFGYEEIDLFQVEQLVDSSQTQGIGLILEAFGKGRLDDRKSLKENLEEIYDAIEKKGLDVLGGERHIGNIAYPRKEETAAAINRFRKLRVE